MGKKSPSAPRVWPPPNYRRHPLERMLGPFGRLACALFGLKSKAPPPQPIRVSVPARSNSPPAAPAPLPRAAPAPPPTVDRLTAFNRKLDDLKPDPLGKHVDSLHALCGNAASMPGDKAAASLRGLFDKIEALKIPETQAALFGSLYKAFTAQVWRANHGDGAFVADPRFAALRADLQRVPERLPFEFRLLFWTCYLECALLSFDPALELDQFHKQIEESLRPRLFGTGLNQMQKDFVMPVYGRMIALMFHLAERTRWDWRKLQSLVLELPEDLQRTWRIHLLTPDGAGVAQARESVDLGRVVAALRGR